MTIIRRNNDDDHNDNNNNNNDHDNNNNNSIIILSIINKGLPDRAYAGGRHGVARAGHRERTGGEEYICVYMFVQFVLCVLCFGLYIFGVLCCMLFHVFIC